MKPASAQALALPQQHTAIPRNINGQASLTLSAIALLLVVPSTRSITTNVLADAYWQVTSYVAFTLLVVHLFQSRLSIRGRLFAKLRERGFNQILFACGMGVLPGCGGAIVVMTQFVKGRLSFGAVVAALTATMGDAAFLLLAAAPMAGLQALSISVVAGLLTGLVVDRVHGQDFLRPRSHGAGLERAEAVQRHATQGPASYQGVFWQVVMLPTFCIALLGSFQYDGDALLGLHQGTLAHVGAGLAVVALGLWTLGSRREYDDCATTATPMDRRTLFAVVAQETHYVTSWVVFGFLCFEFGMLATGFDPSSTAAAASWLLIPAAVAVGWIPGCGPQILTTTLYISGQLPFSAQLGNAISNDGDALFPALALAPRAALVATFYSTLPALVAAYGYAFLFEW